MMRLGEEGHSVLMGSQDLPGSHELWAFLPTISMHPKCASACLFAFREIVSAPRIFRGFSNAAPSASRSCAGSPFGGPEWRQYLLLIHLGPVAPGGCRTLARQKLAGPGPAKARKLKERVCSPVGFGVRTDCRDTHELGNLPFKVD